MLGVTVRDVIVGDIDLDAGSCGGDGERQPDSRSGSRIRWSQASKRSGSRKPTDVLPGAHKRFLHHVLCQRRRRAGSIGPPHTADLCGRPSAWKRRRDRPCLRSLDKVPLDGHPPLEPFTESGTSAIRIVPASPGDARTLQTKSIRITTRRSVGWLTSSKPASAPVPAPAEALEPEASTSSAS